MDNKEIIYRKSFWGYVMDDLFGNNPSQTIQPIVQEFCSGCGKKEVFARCSKRRCNKPLCIECAIKVNGRYFCKKHSR